MDWFFGVDMAAYHLTGDNPKVTVVPDTFLGLGVERKKGGKSHDSQAYPTSDEMIEATQSQLMAERQKLKAASHRADAERQKAEQMADYLRSLGVDPDNLPKS